MTHIRHLEDLLLTDGIEAVENVMTDIQCGSFDVSIKYDGSPAIVFGTDADGTFIATKGYFNKTPVKFYSHDELIEKCKDHGLLVKLTAAFAAIRSCRIPEGNIYWGDLMYWDGNYKSFQPNVVRYYNGDCDKRVGIAVHTQLAGDVPYQDCVSPTVWTPQTSMLALDLPKWEGLPHKAYAKTIDDVLCRMIAADGPDFWTRYVNYRLKDRGSTDLDYHMAWVYLAERHQAGRMTRESLKEKEKVLHSITGPDWFKMRETFNAIEKWKVQAYKELNLHAQMSQTAVIGQEFWHEGFVLKTPSATVKLVDRERFSVANFALWSKS